MQPKNIIPISYFRLSNKFSKSKRWLEDTNVRQAHITSLKEFFLMAIAQAQVEGENLVDCFLKAITWMWELRLHLIIENK